MDKLPAFLRKQFTENGSAIFPVMITLRDGEPLPSAIAGTGSFVLQDKIYAANLSGSSILLLANNESVEAIELDFEVGTI